MSAVESLRARLPENARDTKLNLQSVMQSVTLTARQKSSKSAFVVSGLAMRCMRRRAGFASYDGFPIMWRKR